MTDRKKKHIGEGIEDINQGLNGLFGVLGDAIGEMVTRLEDGNAGAVTRDQVFETPKGPIRAQAGVRLRMGGLDTGDIKEPPKPYTAGRVNPEPEPTPINPLSYEILEDEDCWLLTTDIPGVTREEVAIRQDATVLIIETKGTRRYAARVDLETPFAQSDITKTLKNGILTLRISKENSA